MCRLQVFPEGSCATLLANPSNTRPQMHRKQVRSDVRENLHRGKNWSAEQGCEDGTGKEELVTKLLSSIHGFSAPPSLH